MEQTEQQHRAILNALREATDEVSDAPGAWDWCSRVVAEVATVSDGSDIEYADAHFEYQEDGGHTAQLLVITKHLLIVADGEARSGERPEHTTTVRPRGDLRRFSVEASVGVGRRSAPLDPPGNVRLTLDYGDTQFRLPMGRPTRARYEAVERFLPSITRDLVNGAKPLDLSGA